MTEKLPALVTISTRTRTDGEDMVTIRAVVHDGTRRMVEISLTPEEFGRSITGRIHRPGWIFEAQVKDDS